MLAKINIGDWGIKAGALVLAVFLWFHAITEKPYETETEIRVLIEDPPPGDGDESALIVASETPDIIRVLATGRGKDLLQLDGDAFALRIKAGGSTRIHRLNPSQIEKRATDLDVHITEIIEPKEIEIALDRRMEREIPVRAQLQLEVAEAHVQVGAIQTVPSHIRVSGPRAQVEQLAFVMTDSVGLQNVSDEVSLELPLRHPERTRLIFDPERVRVYADIQILAEDDLSGITLAVRNADRVAVRPDPAIVRVKVRGGVDVIAKLNPAEDLDLYVDYLEYQGESLTVRSAETTFFEVLDITPDKVNLIRE